MKELIVQASKENLTKVMAFLEDCLENEGCHTGISMQIQIALEEVFINVANYAYYPQKGDAIIGIDMVHDPDGRKQIVIKLVDSGRQYNPLLNVALDITIPVEERPVGGLGILMTKKIMDEMGYEYVDNMNILIMRKQL